MVSAGNPAKGNQFGPLDRANFPPLPSGTAATSTHGAGRRTTIRSAAELLRSAAQAEDQTDHQQQQQQQQYPQQQQKSRAYKPSQAFRARFATLTGRQLAEGELPFLPFVERDFVAETYVSNLNFAYADVASAFYNERQSFRQAARMYEHITLLKGEKGGMTAIFEGKRREKKKVWKDGFQLEPTSTATVLKFGSFEYNIPQPKDFCFYSSPADAMKGEPSAVLVTTFPNKINTYMLPNTILETHSNTPAIPVTVITSNHATHQNSLCTVNFKSTDPQPINNFTNALSQALAHPVIRCLYRGSSLRLFFPETITPEISNALYSVCSDFSATVMFDTPAITAVLSTNPASAPLTSDFTQKLAPVLRCKFSFLTVSSVFVTFSSRQDLMNAMGVDMGPYTLTPTEGT